MHHTQRTLAGRPVHTGGVALTNPIKTLAEYEAEIRAANDNQTLECVGRMRSARLVSLRSEEAVWQDAVEAGHIDDDDSTEVAIETGVYDE